MTTREHILQTADDLIRKNGYNAFSFVDIANVVGIKKPSIYHHFPHKTDLGVAVIQYHLENLEMIKQNFKDKSALEKLDKFLSIYLDIKYENKVCLVGSLSTDFNTLDIAIKNKLKEYSDVMLDWVCDFLNEGKKLGTFHFNEAPRTKAILIISNMIAMVQISRLTSDKDFNLVTKSIKQELLKNNI
ncbi:autorepressor PsrA [Sphingobacterium siyangense subsp. cladoniae]|uniref:TetR/AcrR family transcriptional regulator n=1 Tax=Sphingobacterium siyangense TaxID=459529 RepID=UPI0031F86634